MKKDYGFTVVELLIVIVVVAILAAISIVAYTGIQNRTYDSIVQSDIAHFQKKMELAKIDLGHYPRSNAQLPDDFTITKSAYDTKANNVYYTVNFTTDTYALGVRSKSGKGFIVTPSGVQTPPTNVKGSLTASAAGAPWVNDSNTFATQGYFSSQSAWSLHLKIVRD